MKKDALDKRLRNTYAYMTIFVLMVFSLVACGSASSIEAYPPQQESDAVRPSPSDPTVTNTIFSRELVGNGINEVEHIDQAPISVDFLDDPNGKSCFLPCWYGLRPYTSTFEETNATLTRLYGLPKGLPWNVANGLNDSQVAYFYTVFSLQDEQLRRVTASFDNRNHLYVIEITESLDNQGDLHLERILFKLGQPDEIWVDPTYRIDEVTSVTLRIELFYFEHGLSFGYVFDTPLVMLENGNLRTDLCLEEERSLVNKMIIFPEHDYSLYGRYTWAYEGNGDSSASFVSFEDFFLITVQEFVSHVEQKAGECISSIEW